MKKRILILSLYPAPYRFELFLKFLDDYDIDVFFEKSGGDQRDDRWFLKGNYKLLEEQGGKEEFAKACGNLKNYDLVVLYEYATKESIKLIQKCKKQEVPYVINCDGVILPHKKHFLKDLVKKFLLSKAEACLASGQHAKEYFLRYGVDENKIFLHKFSTLHENEIMLSPISKEEKVDIRKKLNLPLNKKIAIAVGRFIPLKRYDFLLREWKKIDDKYCLLLIGGGEEYERYKQITNEFALNNVIIEKFHPPKELYEYYKAADVFIHPTSYDVWGLVINEAMSVGLPIIASNTCVAGLELIRDGKNGFLFAMGDEEKAVEALEKVLGNDDLANEMANECIKTIQKYTVENMAKTQMEVFERIIK